jgi:hypothetical protein
VRKTLLFFGMFLILIYSSVAEASISTWGARAAAKDTDLTVEEMLRYAIEDEYLAHAEYAAIIKKFGAQRPFSNIIRAEESHIAWLKDAYAQTDLSVPKDKAETFALAPASLNAAFQAGIDAEVENIAMYEVFIASEPCGKPENSALKSLFIRLRDASKNHLAAFRRGL